MQTSPTSSTRRPAVPLPAGASARGREARAVDDVARASAPAGRRASRPVILRFLILILILIPIPKRRRAACCSIVDGHCYAYRAFFGISTLTSPSGQPTNAIYGFIRMLGKMQARLQPSHCVVVWDGGLAAERMSLLPDYKAQRAEMPAALAPQLDQMVEYLRAAGVASLMKEGCEADDGIAALAAQAVAAGLPVVDRQFGQGFYAVGIRPREAPRAAGQVGIPVGRGAGPAKDGRGAGPNRGLVEPGRATPRTTFRACRGLARRWLRNCWDNLGR